MADRELTEEERRALQLQELELLDRFADLCRTEGLTWYLTAGTLLGAVRHQGFIPWDDDIDVSMPRRDYDRLRELCTRSLEPPLYYQDETTEDSYPFFFAKLRREDRPVYDPALVRLPIRGGVYVDIFPLDACPAKDRSGRLFFKAVELITVALFERVNPDFHCGYTKWYMKALVCLLRPLPNRTLKRLRRRVTAWAGRGATQRLCTVGGCHGYPRETYQAAWFANSGLLLFEGRQFPVPGEWDALLTSMYGDYRNPPPPEELPGHFQHCEKEDNR